MATRRRNSAQKSAQSVNEPNDSENVAEEIEVYAIEGRNTEIEETPEVDAEPLEAKIEEVPEPTPVPLPPAVSPPPSVLPRAKTQPPRRPRNIPRFSRRSV